MGNAYSRAIRKRSTVEVAKNPNDVPLVDEKLESTVEEESEDPIMSKFKKPRISNEGDLDVISVSSAELTLLTSPPPTSDRSDLGDRWAVRSNNQFWKNTFKTRGDIKNGSKLQDRFLLPMNNQRNRQRDEKHQYIQEQLIQEMRRTNLILARLVKREENSATPNIQEGTLSDKPVDLQDVTNGISGINIKESGIEAMPNGHDLNETIRGYNGLGHVHIAAQRSRIQRLCSNSIKPGNTVFGNAESLQNNPNRLQIPNTENKGTHLIERSRNFLKLDDHKNIENTNGESNNMTPSYPPIKPVCKECGSFREMKESEHGKTVCGLTHNRNTHPGLDEANLDKLQVPLQGAPCTSNTGHNIKQNSTTPLAQIAPISRSPKFDRLSNSFKTMKWDTNNGCNGRGNIGSIKVMCHISYSRIQVAKYAL